MENLSVDMSKSALAQGSIASRFESQTTVDEARERREKEWKEAYARIGQEAPEMKEEEPIQDGRTLYERLQSAQAAKDEEWETRLKLGNQFRGLHEEEFQFLSAEDKKKRDQEAQWKAEEKKELAEYREQLAAKTAALEAAATPALPGGSSGSIAAKPRIPGKAIKKDVKSLMKGVVVKKKPKAEPVKSSKPEPSSTAPLPTNANPPQSPPSALKAPKRPVEPSLGEEAEKKQKI